MRKFWNWVRDSDEERTLYLNGVISDETWWGDEVTPKLFKDELTAGSGNITVWINSPGGDVFAAAQIYNMLMDYTGNVTVKIDGLAASAASVIAMAGGDVYMSPVSMLMIHNPSTVAIGDSEEMLRAKALLDEVKDIFKMHYREMVVILEKDNSYVGITVDEVLSVENIIPYDDTEEVRKMCRDKYVCGVAKSEKNNDILLILDEEKIMNISEIQDIRL